MNCIVKNTTYYLELGVIANNGNFVSGLTITYNIYKSSDNTLIQTGTLTEIGTSGVYKDSATFTTADQYRIEYFTPIPYENTTESILVVDVSMGDLDDKITRILGLSNENMKLISPRYDRHGNLIDGQIKIYASASDADNDINPIATYRVTAYHNKKLAQELKIVKES